MRLIDADKLMEFAKNHANGSVDCNDIARFPRVDAVPVRHGRWDDSGRYRFKDGSVAVRCTACGCVLNKDEYIKYAWVYCPICGAKMDGGADDD